MYFRTSFPVPSLKHLAARFLHHREATRSSAAAARLIFVVVSRKPCNVYKRDLYRYVANSNATNIVGPICSLGCQQRETTNMLICAVYFSAYKQVSDYWWCLSTGRLLYSHLELHLECVLAGSFTSGFVSNPSSSVVCEFASLRRLAVVLSMYRDFVTNSNVLRPSGSDVPYIMPSTQRNL